MRDQSSTYSHSKLFTVRLWVEDMGSAGAELRGEVRHVPSGGVRYFLEWATLIAYLTEKMQELETQPNGGDSGGDSIPAHIDA